jgi:CRP-like cAMP-binding protein
MKGGTVKNTKTGTSKKAGKAASTTQGPRFDSKSFLTSVATGRSRLRYRPRETIYRQGAVADAVFYIQQGKVRLTAVSEHGKEAMIAQLVAGEFFGEGCLAGQDIHMASAIAAGEATIVRIDKPTMVRVLHEQPALSEMFMAFLLSRNVQIEADLVDQLFNSSERRLARLLLLLANFGKEGKMKPVMPQISREILAAKVGTTPSRINFFMNKFRKLGFIEYDGGASADAGRLRVHTSLLNVIIHD